MADAIPAPPIVVVHWEDASNCATWTDRDQAQAFTDFEFDVNCTNVGYLLRDDDECVVVGARATGDFKEVGLVERIPRGCVQSVTVIRKGTAVKPIEP